MLLHVAIGENDRVIAKQLSIAPATVKAHMRNTKAKLNAQTRPHAVALALLRGVINPSGESSLSLDAEAEEAKTEAEEAKE